MLQVNVQTVGNWEAGRDQPDFWCMPRIAEFLGYDPRPESESGSLGSRLRAFRLKHGLTQRSFAARMQVNVCSVSGWEGGDVVPTQDSLARILKILGNE